MTLPGRIDPYTAYNFAVEIEGLLVGGFSEVSGLEVKIEVEDYREGGTNGYVHRLPGPTSYPSNLTLKRGLTDSEILWDWHQDATRGLIRRKNGTIYLLDQAGSAAMWWDFREAYPVQWTGPSLSAMSNALAVESIELAHRGLRKRRA